MGTEVCASAALLPAPLPPSRCQPGRRSGCSWAGANDPARGAFKYHTVQAHAGFLCPAGNTGFDQQKMAELIVVIF